MIAKHSIFNSLHSSGKAFNKITEQFPNCLSNFLQITEAITKLRALSEPISDLTSYLNLRNPKQNHDSSISTRPVMPGSIFLKLPVQLESRCHITCWLAMDKKRRAFNCSFDELKALIVSVEERMYRLHINALSGLISVLASPAG